MEITDFGHFTISDPNAAGVVHYANQEGYDWYDMRRSLTDWEVTGAFVSAIYGAWAMVDADGVVTNVEYDPSRLVPDNKTVLGIDASHHDIAPGMIYREGRLE